MTPQRGKTKIVCTLGPASSSVGTLVDLIQSGVGVMRLNFSHGTQEQHIEVLKNVHQAVEQSGVVVSVLQDLQGPKIRIGELSVPSIDLRHGEKLVITTEPLVG
ncbi:MAG TPA: pyruvate kinase, partial [Bacteroidota bacterium]